ncbi:hypothetical protein K461DRAFT_179709 [Myriangium duriaei CBS 260.36]|uniref:Uncharacterized protein n=1 Tax=Myriangium duriaei CBS 260.36 TaxID=1168546 RepID=A0A9P4MF43_9PEZI|nr:hypothetical protein K461DRAFT_179709 [Myriangium duriaei CBS 260.36]
MELLDLPAEIRNHIYSLLLEPSANRTTTQDKHTYYHFSQILGLFSVNKQVRAEALPIFHSLNQFIVIDTPWADAETHVHIEGQVPVVVPGGRAAEFTTWTLLARIHAPDVGLIEGVQKFVLHIDDLPAFCNTWRYSDLSHPGLNPLLYLELELRDPSAKSWDEPRIPKALQQRLLLPFGIVKELRSVKFTGDVTAVKSVVDEMKKRMAEPHESPESCLRRATAMKDAGNTALREKKYDDALECYRKAWLAMHIVVNGRKRHIHGDMWFNRELKEEPFKGMQGHTVRLALRVKLVANTVQLYLLMERFEDAQYWGMRTIGMIRSAIGLGENEEAERPEDEAIRNFMSDDVGKIYFRTAMAWKALNDMYEARKLLKVAQVYLPNDRRVREEVTASAPRVL